MGRFCPDSVDIVDGRNIWLCNSFGVFTSNDGGRSLQQMYSPYDGCRIMSFADEDHGWSSFDWNIAATSDGALRWVEVEKDFAMGDIAALFLRTPQEGYVLTYDGILFTTSDGGGSWTSIDLEIVDDDMRIANMDGRPAAAMRFMDLKKLPTHMRPAGYFVTLITKQLVESSIAVCMDCTPVSVKVPLWMPALSVR